MSEVKVVEAEVEKVVGEVKAEAVKVEGEAKVEAAKVEAKAQAELSGLARVAKVAEEESIVFVKVHHIVIEIVASILVGVAVAAAVIELLCK